MLIANLGQIVESGLVPPRIRRRQKSIYRELDLHAEHAAELTKLSQLEGPTHGQLPTATSALCALQSSLVDRYGLELETGRSIESALKSSKSLDREIRDSIPERRSLTEHGIEYGQVAAYADEAESGLEAPPNLYSDHMSLNRVVREFGPRKLLLNLGGLVDDVRMLHDRDLERVVLNVTLWARLLVLLAAPLLAAASFGRTPLAGGFAWSDSVWLLALVVAAGTAAFSTRIADAVMRRDAAGRESRKRLLLVEVPVACGLLVLAPSWPVIVFSVGWINWWQRPVYRWRVAAIWIALCAGLIVAGGVARSSGSTLALLPELGIAMATMAIIGSSYGAILPLSLSVPVREIRIRSRARRVADQGADLELSALANKLRRVVETVEAQYPDELQSDRSRLLGIAADLESSRAPERKQRGGSSGLESLLGGALGVGQSSGDSILYVDPSLRILRLRKRSQAQALRAAVRQLAVEARQHGSGRLETQCFAQANRVTLDFMNPVSRASAEPGWGTGEERIRRLLANIPGARIDSRGRVGDDLRPRFRVQLSIPLAAFS